MKSFFGIFLLVCLGAPVMQARTVYVNGAATGTNNGTSWANAYTSLSTAMSSALNNDTLWVAAGTYTPGTTRTSAFSPAVANLALFGGFAGTETSLSQRNVAANVTILSGEIGLANDKYDNCYNVIAINADIITHFLADGFVVEKSYANNTNSGIGFYDRGGAMFVLGYTATTGTAVMRNCIVRGNGARYGGAVAVQGKGTMRVENCWIYANQAINDVSVGYNDDQMYFTNCFIDTRQDIGGFSCISGTGVTCNTYVSFTTILGNKAVGSGGNTDQFVMSHSIIENYLTFYSNSGNTADHCYLPNIAGGSMLAQTNPIPRVVYENPNAPAATTIPADFALKACSPGLNAATQATYDLLSAPATDLLGNPRNVGGMIDIGAMELQVPAMPEMLLANKPVGDTAACGGQPMVLYPNATSVYGNLKYEWLVDGNSYANSDSLSLQSAGNGTLVSYIVTNACASDTSAAQTLHVSVPGFISMAIRSFSACEGQALKLAVEYTSPPSLFADNIVTWYRMVGMDLGPQVGTGDTLLFSPVTPANAGDYKYTYAHACAAGGPVTSNWHTVSVGTKYNGPAPVLAQQGNQIIANQDFETYIWFLNGVPVDTTDSYLDTGWNIFTPTAEGTYTVGVALGGGICGDTMVLSAPVAFLFVSAEKDFGKLLTISPNPAKDQVRIGGLTGPARCRIVNGLGQVVHRAELEPDGLLVLPAALAPGLYTVQVENLGSLRLEVL